MACNSVGRNLVTDMCGYVCVPRDFMVGGCGYVCVSTTVCVLLLLSVVVMEGFHIIQLLYFVVAMYSAFF